MHILTLTADDYDALYALWLSCAGMGLNDLDDSREGIARFIRRNPTTCFGAWEGDALIGGVLAGNDGRRGYIYHTAVRPDRQGRGIGRQLVEAAVGALVDCGVRKAALVAFRRNASGNAFWEHMGFTQRDDLSYRNRAFTEMKRIDT